MTRFLWSDEDMLRVLDLRAAGKSCDEIAARFSVSKGSIAGQIHRIREDTKKTDVSPHLNGTMKPDWWKQGLRKRG